MYIIMINDKYNYNIQGLQILLMGERSVTSALQILESLWNIWSQVTH